MSREKYLISGASPDVKKTYFKQMYKWALGKKIKWADPDTLPISMVITPSMLKKQINTTRTCPARVTSGKNKISRKYIRKKMPRYRRKRTCPKSKGNHERRIARLEGGGNLELKTHDKSSGPTAYSASGTVIYLSGIAQGDQNLDDREGLEIKAKELKLDLWSTNTSTADAHNRCIIIADRMNQGAPPAVTDNL